jgi:hypothetical protein
MRTPSRDDMGKLETSENAAKDMAEATIELAKSMTQMSDKELELAVEQAEEDMMEAVDEAEHARLKREWCSMRLTVMEYEQVRRLICSA